MGSISEPTLKGVMFHVEQSCRAGVVMFHVKHYVPAALLQHRSKPFHVEQLSPRKRL